MLTPKASLKFVGRDPRVASRLEPPWDISSIQRAFQGNCPRYSEEVCADANYAHHLLPAKKRSDPKRHTACASARKSLSTRMNSAKPHCRQTITFGNTKTAGALSSGIWILISAPNSR